jgi:uncharacterized heparinase superfamily protein
MSALVRYAAAIYHLGPRQAARNLLHRARRRTRSFARYARAGSGLEWAGRARTPFLAHAGGARLERGRFTAVGSTRDVGDPPDWELEAPLLWLFNLHYFAWLAALARDEQRRLVLDWILRYQPSARRPGWMNYPLALRLRNWATLLFDADGWPDPERTRVLASIEAQAECLADTLEHHLRGNHLLEGAITLKLLSACFRGPAVARWQRRADAVLDTELAEQFLLDGGHVERSPMYHARLAHGLIDLANVLPESDEMRVRIEQRLPAILRFVSAMSHPDGELALFNDAALGIAPEPGAILEYARRLGFDAPPFASGSFPETGYHVWRSGNAALFVDAGPIGPDYLPAHGHGDIFSFELSLDGRRVVVDGGTSSYEAGPERDWARSTRAHNTVEIGGADQAEFFGAFRVGRRGRPSDVVARVSDDGLQLSGWHNGYRRLAGSPVHHRELQFVAPAALFVWDTVESRVPQPVLSRLRFPPGARLRLEGTDAAVIEVAGVALSLRSFGGALSIEDGHYAPRFGERVACRVLALHKGAQPEFGFALARSAVSVRIQPEAGGLGGRTVPRQSRRLESARAAA